VAATLGMPYLGPWVTLLGYFALLFAVTKTADSGWGLVWVFALTGFMGLTLGPIVNFYVKVIPDGHSVVVTAFGITAAAFLALSAYAIMSGRRFSFMGGFLTVGIITAFLLGLVAILFSMPTLALAVSGLFVMLMGGLILYETGEIIHGGETNYIHATVTLYVSIYNMFTSLLHLLGSNR
jgi:modulator of FtsH protease